VILRSKVSSELTVEKCLHHLEKCHQTNVDSAEEMMQNLRNVFKEIILEETWMSAPTQKVAVQKLENMFIQVAHGKWQVYTHTHTHTRMYVYTPRR